MPKVSVVIPCYNQGQYVDEAVESVLDQTYQDFEIIIVNDGSTDAFTNNLLKNYHKPKTRVIHTNNQGLASARNNGIKEARGEYILPLDADDKIGKDYLEAAVMVLDEKPGVGIVYSEAETFGAVNGKWEMPEYSIEEMLIDNIIFCSGFYRKKDWEKVGGYDPEMVLGWEDYDFWLSLIETGALVYRIPKTLFYYRIVDGSMVRSKTKEQKIEMFTKIFNKHEDLYKNNIQIWIAKIIDINTKDKHIENLEVRIGENNRLIQEQAHQIQAKDSVIEEQAHQIQAKDSHINNIESELDLIKGSLAWRLAELFRKTVYIKVLGKFPLLQRGVLTIKREGFFSFIYKVRAYLKRNKYFATLGFVEADYERWVKKNKLTEEEIEKIRKEIAGFQYRPKISIIMPVYNVDRIWLEKAIESVLNQLYENWELCVADDASTKKHIKQTLERYSKKEERIKIKYLEENHGISGASNEALRLVTGEFVGLLDNDDELTKDALCEVVKAINENGFDIIYSDEALVNKSGKTHAIHFKPDFSPDLLLSHNYITHLLVVKKSLFQEIGGFCSKYDGAQDYELVLKVSERTTKIYHIPKVLYHWRSIPGSTSENPESKSYADKAGKEALEAALDRRKIVGNVLYTNTRFYYRVKRDLHYHPLISIIIPFKDEPEYLKSCIAAILDKSSYQNFEIIGISNNSGRNETLEVMTDLQEADKRIRFYEYNIPFNYSKINNYAVALAGGEHIALMNNDIEIISTDWIESLLEHSQREDVGAVGGKLYYADDTIQHAGVICGIAGFAGHSHRHFNRKEAGYFNRLMCIQNVSAVTGALLMVKKRLYQDVGGLDEKNLGVGLNDVDFCLKLRERGYLNIYTPYCEAYHHESVSRGYEDTPENMARFNKEKVYFQWKWKDLLANGDPYYNPNLTLDREDFSIRI